MSKLLLKAKSKTLGGMARTWATLRRKEEEVEKSRKSLGKILMAAMLAAGVRSVDVGKAQCVQQISTKKKSLTKTDIMAFFGKEKGEQFWAGLEDDISEYLTLANCETKKASR